MTDEGVYTLPDGEARRRFEVQTELTAMEQVEPNTWARQLRRW